MAEQMQCMEVWGGNRSVEKHFQMPGLQVWLYSRPFDDAVSGGDVYYLSSCASGRISRLLLADVSGHGPPVSQCALRLRELMRRNINSISQARLVEGMNEEFTNFNRDGNFATAVVGTFFASTGTFQLCTAGHPQPLLFRQETQTWEVFETAPDSQRVSQLSGIPLGIVAGAKYSQARFAIQPGDMILAYTDGLTETEVAKDQLLNTEGLLSLIHSLDASQPDRLLTNLLTALRQQSTGPSGDDLTVLLARADRSGVSWHNNLLAPLRLFRPARDATRFRTSWNARSSEH